MEGDRVVDAVAHEADVDPGAPGDLDDPRLLLRTDAGEHRGSGDGGGEGVVVETLDFGATENRLHVDTYVAADLFGHDAVVAGDDLDGHPQPVELGDRRPGIGLGPVDEGEETGEMQLSLVVGFGIDETRRVACGNRDDASTIGEEPLRGCRHFRRNVNATAEDGLRAPLVTRSVVPAAVRAVTEASWRSWSNGAMPRRW